MSYGVCIFYRLLSLFILCAGAKDKLPLCEQQIELTDIFHILFYYFNVSRVTAKTGSCMVDMPPNLTITARFRRVI